MTRFSPRRLMALLRGDSGAASIEFVIFFPLFFTIFISAFELTMMNLRALQVEQATDVVVREIRLNDGGEIKYDDILKDLCAEAPLLRDCEEIVRIEMRPVDKSTWEGLPTRVDCIKRDEEVQPDVSFENGQQNELMMVRVCAVFDPLFPTIGVGRSIPKDRTGAYLVTATSAFVNEPD